MGWATLWITSFTSEDFFEFKASAFGGLGKGALHPRNFDSRADNRAQDTNDHFIFRTTDDTLWFDSNGSKSGGLTEIADLSNDFALKAHDIPIGWGVSRNLAASGAISSTARLILHVSNLVLIFPR